MRFRWNVGNDPPFKITRNNVKNTVDTVVDGDTVYLMGDQNVYGYNTTTGIWSKFSHNMYRRSALTIVNNLVTLVGGDRDGKATNKLFSLTKRAAISRWTEVFPSMPTKRRSVGALCTRTGTALVVAGGVGVDEQVLAVIEVMNTESHQWFTAIDLPEPLFYGSLIDANDGIYVLGRSNKHLKHMKSVYTCSLGALLDTCRSRSLGVRIARSLLSIKSGTVWVRISDTPVRYSSYVSLRGQLLAIGGLDSQTKTTTAIHMYIPSSNSWEVVTHMATPRQQCYAAVLPGDRLIVIGGETSITDAVEVATLL